MTLPSRPHPVPGDKTLSGRALDVPVSRRVWRDRGVGALMALAVVGWGFAVAGFVGVGEDRGFVRADEPDTDTHAEYVIRTESSSTGTALVFLLNTRTQVLNVYEAEGGTRATRGLSFVASRKIARDIFVTGYNDRSEYSYQDLLKRFELEEARQDALEGKAGDKP